MSAANLITSTIDYAALAYAPPPFARVNGEVRRTEGYVVVMRFLGTFVPFTCYFSHDTCCPFGPLELSSCKGELAASIVQLGPTIQTMDVSGQRRLLSLDSAKSLFADVCADLRRGGAAMRQWSEARPFQVILARTTFKRALVDPPDYEPIKYASGPRWIPTKERPVDETP